MMVTMLVPADGETPAPGGGSGGNGSGFTPNIQISWDYFPWLKPLVDMVGGLQAVGLTLLAAAVIGGAGLWAVSHMTDMGHVGTRAKIGIGVCCVAAAIVGSAATIVGFFADNFHM